MDITSRETMATDGPDCGSDNEASPPLEIFQEPASFRPPSPPPTIVEHITSSGQQLKIRLVGGHPLWGHVLYPASIALSRYIETNSSSLFPSGQSTRVLELGAGGGLPGLTCALSGAELVVSTDFPDPDLIKNLEWNADHNLPSPSRHRLVVQGLKWGSTLDASFQPSQASPDESSPNQGPARFDLILLSDLVFNHSQHASLLMTCEYSLTLPDGELDGQRPQPALLVFYSHHRPWCVDADEQFIVLARERGWRCTKILEDKQAGLAFPEDGGDPLIRGTVHGWMLTR